MIHTCTDSLKFKRLHRRLGFRAKRETIGLLEALWHFTMRNAPRGDVGRLTNLDIAIELEWDGDPDELVAALVAERWLDEHPEYRLVVHDWADYAPNFVKGNVKRMGGFCVQKVENEAPPERTAPKDHPKRTASKAGPVATVPHNITKQNITKPSSSPNPSTTDRPRLDDDPQSASPEEEGEEDFDFSSREQAEPSDSATDPYEPLVARLRALGMNAAEDCIDHARQRKLSPDAIAARIDHFAKRPGAWNVGQLNYVLRKARSDEAAAIGWPEPAEAYRKQATAATKQAEPRTPSAEEVRIANRRAFEAKEARYGPTIDALDPEIARHVVTTVFAKNAMLLERFRRDGIKSPIVREFLFGWLDKGGRIEDITQEAKA